MNNKEEIKEDFCGACVAGIAALAGVGTATVGTNTTKNKHIKKIVFWSSMTVSLLSIMILIYLLCFKKCTKCA